MSATRCVRIGSGKPFASLVNLVPSGAPGIPGGGGSGTSPWVWLGNWFPTLEGTKVSADTGDGTLYPINFNLALGDSSDGQIVPFEWGTKQITWTGGGTVTKSFQDPMGGPNQSATANFTINVDFPNSAFPTATTWNELEPSDYVDANAGDSFAGFGSFYGTGIPGVTVDPFVLPWGNETAGFIGGLNMGKLYVVTDASAVYVKLIEIVMFMGNGAGSLLVSTNVNTDDFIGPFAFQPLSNTGGTATLFHSTANMWWGADDPAASITFTSCALTVTDNYTQPPNI